MLTARPPHHHLPHLGAGQGRLCGAGQGRRRPTLPSYPGLQPGTSLCSGSLGKAAAPCQEWEPGL